MTTHATSLTHKQRPPLLGRMGLYAAGLALLLQSLFPAGYMPGSLEDGWVAKICPDGLPASFVEALYAPQQLQTGHHDHHGMGDAGVDEGHGNHHEDHGAMGSCQLGSSLDQPLHLLAQVDVSLNDGLVPLLRTAPLVVYVAPQYFAVRARAPPTTIS